METKQAVLPLSAPVSTSILLCLGNRHNHITVCDETIFVSLMTLYRQAGHSSIQMLFCFAKCLLSCAQNPICSASCRCRLRVCSKHFYNKKDSLGLFHNRRILGCRCLSRLHFFCAALFFCKEQFYISLRTKKLLHFLFRFAIVRVAYFLFCQQF